MDSIGNPTSAVRPENQIYLETLSLYLEALEPDPCHDQALRYYMEHRAHKAYDLDGNGSPVRQMLADAKAEDAAYLKETAQAIQRASVLVWHPGALKKAGRWRPDRFSGAAGQVLAALEPPPAEPVVLTMEGVRRGRLTPKQQRHFETWLEAYRVEFEAYRAACLRTGVKGYKEISLFTFVGFAGGLGLGALLDAFGASTSAIGEWAVRTISGEGEDIAEGAWVLRKTAAAQRSSHARKRSRRRR